jgi:hypothetical protein
VPAPATEDNGKIEEKERRERETKNREVLSIREGVVHLC